MRIRAAKFTFGPTEGFLLWVNGRSVPALPGVIFMPYGSRRTYVLRRTRAVSRFLGKLGVEPVDAGRPCWLNVNHISGRGCYLKYYPTPVEVLASAGKRLP